MFRKSSFSKANGDCIEAGAFRKSSFSQGASNCAEVGFRKSSASESGHCAEVGFRKPSASVSGNCAEAGSDGTEILVRDTKEAHLGSGRSVVSFSPDAWRKFIAGVKAVDRPGIVS